jgi:hypothetical protein
LNGATVSATIRNVSQNRQRNFAVRLRRANFLLAARAMD